MEERFIEVEVYHIETTNEGSFAYISYKDLEWHGDDPTNGYNHIKVPLKLRPIQKSIRGNTLTDQSEKNYHTVSN